MNRPKRGKKSSPKNRLPQDPTRRQQMRQLRKRQRMLTGLWFKPVWLKTELPAPKWGPEERENWRIAKEKSGYTSSSIMRIGLVGRKGTRGGSLLIPFTATEYKEWIGAKETRGHEKMVKSRRIERFNRVPYNIGANAILEIVGKKGRYVLMIERPPNVGSGAPSQFDFVAGLIRTGQSPVEGLRKRISSELGISGRRVKLIGPGFKETRNGDAFTLHLKEPRANWDIVYVMRLHMEPEQVLAAFEKAKGDKYKPTRIALIPRTPEAIREFIRTHRKMEMPEPLRLYARELALHPGRGGKKRRARQ